jgi:hypothetical protein
LAGPLAGSAMQYSFLAPLRNNSPPTIAAEALKLSSSTFLARNSGLASAEITNVAPRRSEM